MLCWKDVNIFQENSHKNQVIPDTSYFHQTAVTLCQYLTKYVETHLYCEGNDIQTTTWMLSILSNISNIIFHNLKQNGWFYWFCQQAYFLHMCKQWQVVVDTSKVVAVYRIGSVSTDWVGLNVAKTTNLPSNAYQMSTSPHSHPTHRTYIVWGFWSLQITLQTDIYIYYSQVWLFRLFRIVIWVSIFLGGCL